MFGTSINLTTCRCIQMHGSRRARRARKCEGLPVGTLRPSLPRHWRASSLPIFVGYRQAQSDTAGARGRWPRCVRPLTLPTGQKSRLLAGAGCLRRAQFCANRSRFAPDKRMKKTAPLGAGRRSLACVWRSVFFLLSDGLVFSRAIPPHRTQAFFESLAWSTSPFAAVVAVSGVI